MAKSKAKTIATSNSSSFNEASIVLVRMFIIIAAVNAVVLHFANTISPSSVVLGTMSLNYFWALILSSSVISLATTFIFPFISNFAAQMRHMLTPVEMMAVYFVVNFATVWLVTRESQVFGLGVTSWFVVLVLAVVLDFVQGMAMMLVEKMRS